MSSLHRETYPLVGIWQQELKLHMITVENIKAFLHMMSLRNGNFSETYPNFPPSAKISVLLGIVLGQIVNNCSNTAEFHLRTTEFFFSFSPCLKSYIFKIVVLNGARYAKENLGSTRACLEINQ